MGEGDRKPEAQSPGTGRGPSRAIGGWAVGLICVAIVAAGVVVAGLVHKSESESSSHAGRYVEPPVTYPVAIPGCATVGPPGKGGLTSLITSHPFSYDNPAYPWFSGAKAAAMTQALRDALPGGVEIGFASVEQSLVFQPIPETDTGKPTPLDGLTTAEGTVIRGDRSGSLRVTVRQSSDPIPPCVAGALDERRHLADGGMADTHDSWYEFDKVRTRTRSVRAYLPDGTVVSAVADDAVDGGHSGAVPLTIDELVAMATATPGLRVTTPVPPMTPEPPESCLFATFEFGKKKSKKYDQDTAARLNAVLARVPLDGLTLDRSLGNLRPGGSGGGGLCEVVRATGAQGRSRLAITVGTNEPGADDDSESQYGTTRQLAGGVTVREKESTETDREVTVTHASGSWIRISSTGEVAPLSFAQLEAIALTPGLEVT
ncbi:hypothetical protein [Nocardia terpenica]|uniref:Uncharacterized protein n=1 Tax=Nocardia terpenica TaxID=455432 RepID=A0A291RS65_9NOCA|nr:hypothetical protein [Nocardia terpenica]ATL70099.1 hypothetical protein CRH09_31835 [Nocardia terpenica]